MLHGIKTSWKRDVVGRLGSRHAVLETKEFLQLPLAHRSKPSPKPFRELDCKSIVAVNLYSS